jgi:MoaE-MoaD fusion protein
MAVNRDYATAATPLSEKDELALIPPLSGGARATTDGERNAPAAPTDPDDARAHDDATARVHVAVGERALELTKLAALVSDRRAGAIVTFQGVTREVARLEYEAYREMAVERIATIASECLRSHGLCAIAAEHRVGAVALGEPSVIVAASAPHREQAFAGAREAIDRIKSEATIWKVEVEAGGAPRRVPGTPAPGAIVPGAQLDRRTPPEARE